ncbi:MAG: helix-turn-helix transcriptional regulator [Candidatus Limiplasma sp.]|nr:helix-turn-helix transcriptional regulator [Candidatus Limiplasma sp.]
MQSREPSIVAMNVKRIIARNAWKQGAIGQRAGYPPKVFSAMLNGNLKIHIEDIPRIADVLGVTPNDLFCREQNAS